MQNIIKLVAGYHAVLAEVYAAFDNMLEYTDPKKHALAQFLNVDDKLARKEAKLERVLLYIAHELRDMNDDGTAWQYVKKNITKFEHLNVIIVRSAKLARNARPVNTFNAWQAAGLS
jgi:hypothetical protein